MKWFNRIAFIILALAFLLVFAMLSRIIFNSPADVAKTFIEGMFRLDVAALQSVTCEAKRAGITDELLAESSKSLTSGAFDLSGVTYIYNDATSSVSVGGIIRATVNGIAMAYPANTLIPIGIPVVKEGFRWRVCPLYPMPG